MSPGLPPVGSPMMRPRPAARNAASKSSAGPAVALDTSAAIGPPYEGRSARGATVSASGPRSEEHTSELQSRLHLVCRLLLEKKKTTTEFREHHTDCSSLF